MPWSTSTGVADAHSPGPAPSRTVPATLASVRAGHTEVHMMNYMKLTQNVGAALIVSALLATVVGCENKGPAQKAGTAVDNAADKAGQQIEKAGNNIQDAARGNK
jgi:hypothetical protein